MPVLAGIADRFSRDRPLAGIRIASTCRSTPAHAVLVATLEGGGATVEVAAADAARDIELLDGLLDSRPHILLDDGADAIGAAHAFRRDRLADLLGATEASATGVLRLRAMERVGGLAHPVIAIDEANTKRLFENRYGTGQSAVDALLRSTGLLLAGRTFVIAGYGQCGRGIAERARGFGCQVVVLEVDPIRALQAVFDGFRVMSAERAAPIGDIFCTATGAPSVIRRQHLAAMRDGTVLMNVGHGLDEIDVKALAGLAVAHGTPRDHVDEYTLGDGRRIAVVAQGQLANRAVGDGQPNAVVDLSLSNQALCCAYLVRHGERLDRRVYVVPDDIDREIARAKLAALGVRIDELRPDQAAALAAWMPG